MDEDRRKKIIIWIISGALFMEMIDSSIINTAIPEIAKSLQTAPITLRFAVTSYLLSLAVFIPSSGYMADRFGTKNIFALAIVIFTLSSILCGVSTNITELTVFRAIQGFGGALMTPVARLIMVRSFPPRELVRVTSYVVTPALIGPVIGPLLGGVITQYLSWHWIFFVNVPVGMIALYAVQKFVLNEKFERDYGFDYVGFVLLGAALSCLALSFEFIGEEGIPTNVHFFVGIVGVTSLVLFALYAFFKKEKAVLNFGLFKVRTFRSGVLGNFVSVTAHTGVAFILPLLFQLQFGMTPSRSGLFVAPIAAGGFCMRMFSVRVAKQFGFKKILAVGPFLGCLSFVMLSFISHTSSYFYIVLSGFLLGVAGVLIFSANGPLTYADVPRKLSSNATSIDITVRQFSVSLAIGVAAFLIIVFLHLFHFSHISDVGATRVFRFTFLTLAALCLLQSLVSLGLYKEDGFEASQGHLGAQKS